ncbi:MAG: sigma-70 family RNA polymerase sigma factor [Syntrophomonadaceae bacterium]|nr:sigma-70 family RNA polymerase sigma factor [Syntrophomonadaceae bacterium]
MLDTGAENSESQIEQILRKYSNMVYRLAYARTKNRADAQDLLQEVFLRCLKSNVQFNDDEHCKAWLIRTTINCSKSLLSSAWFSKTVSMKENLPDSLHNLEDEKSEIFYAVLELPVKYRMVVHLYYYEDYSVAELSKLLNRKESTVKTQLYRARELLKQKLKGEYDYV